MRFTKMQGIGNDYIFVNCFEELVSDPSRMAIVMSRPHFGVGSDGLVLIEPADGADAGMRIFNSDGSEAEMCGNALRCIGKYMFERGLTDKTELTLLTKGGFKRLWLQVEAGKVVQVRADFCPVPVAGMGQSMAGRRIGQHTVRAEQRGPQAKGG